MASKYKSKVQDCWLINPRYKCWLTKDVDVYQARCKWCMKSFSVGGQGESALKSHMEGKKHSSFVSARSGNLNALFSRPSTQTKEANSKSTLPTSDSTDHTTKDKEPSIQSGRLSTFVSKEDTLTSEIIWTLHCLNNHHSFMSNAQVAQTFRRMFPDSEIAKNFALSDRKTSYLTTFGLAPYVRSLIEKQLASEDFVLLFDESLNKQFQTKQMDFHVRFWHGSTVITRYLTSAFLGHGTAKDMLSAFKEHVGHLNLGNILQLSMDGPNVNWSLHGKVNELIKSECGVNLLNVGSCGLHKVHGAIKNAMDASGWQLDSILKGLFKFFSDSPARREDFVKVTGTSQFPLHFCKHRWLENVKVAQRALDILPCVKNYFEKCVTPKLLAPAHSTIEGALKDPLLPAKLAFFISLAKHEEPFLADYQTDKPMMPFMFRDITSIIIRILNRFVKEGSLTDLKTTSDFHSFDPEKTLHHVMVHKIQIGYVAESILKNLKASKKVSELQIMDFKSKCKVSLIALSAKLLDKSPLRYGLCNNTACLDPQVMLENKASAMAKMKKVLHSLTSNRNFPLDQCDEVLEQFSEFIDAAVSSGSLSGFSKSDRLDTFYFDCISNDKKYASLWKVVKIVLVLSHGQASVERGFSVNKVMEDSSLAEHTLIARRLVVDFIWCQGGVDKVEVNNHLLVSAGNAYNKYKQYLESEKDKQEKLKRGLKRKEMDFEIEELQKKSKLLKLDIKGLLSSADDFAERAESERKISFITQSNTLRKRAKEKEEEEKAVQKLIEEKFQLLRGSF